MHAVYHESESVSSIDVCPRMDSRLKDYCHSLDRRHFVLVGLTRKSSAAASEGAAG